LCIQVFTIFILFVLPWRDDDDDDDDVTKCLDAFVTCQSCVELECRYFLTLLDFLCILLYCSIMEYYFVLYVLCAASV